MPNRPSRAASSGRKGASIGIGGFGLGDVGSPEQNKYFGKDQEEANIEAGRNVDTQQLYSKPSFWQKLFNPQAATEAERLNADFLASQLISKQNFANQRQMEEARMANTLRAQTMGDEAAMARMVAERGFIGTEGDKARQAQIEGQLRAQRQAEFLAAEQANRDRGFKLEDDLRQNAPVGQAIWHSNYRGELPYDINPETEQDFAKIAKMAPVIFGKQGLESGMLEQPVAESARAANIARNAALAKHAEGLVSKETRTSVAPGTMSYSDSPGVRPLFGSFTEDVISVNPYTKIPQKVGERRVAPSVGKTEAEKAAQEAADLEEAQKAKMEAEAKSKEKPKIETKPSVRQMPSKPGISDIGVLGVGKEFIQRQISGFDPNHPALLYPGLKTLIPGTQENAAFSEAVQRFLYGKRGY